MDLVGWPVVYATLNYRLAFLVVNNMVQNTSFDVLIVGGGAAGLLCASLAAQRGKRVALLERTAKVGKKILMSGGGRCNFTNLDITPENYLSQNPHFCKSALSRYTQWDFIGLVCDYGIPYHEKKSGQLFCDNSAKDILDMLLAECHKYQVVIHTRCEIESLEHNGNFRLATNQGFYTAEAVVIASGGLSIPTMGVTGFGYQLARQFDMAVVPTSAALVPFTLSDPLKAMANRLSGISVDVVAENARASFRENLLFTHRGLSGPAMLQLSSYWRPGEAISINLLPDLTLPEWLLAQKAQQPKLRLRSVLGQALPKKLVAELESLCWHKETTTPLAEINHETLHDIARQLAAWQIKPASTEGYRTAEVTLGGVATEGLSSKTMESRHQNGLFFIGEVVDVTGHLGGYNFQWAWSSAYAAAQAL